MGCLSLCLRCCFKKLFKRLKQRNKLKQRNSSGAVLLFKQFCCLRLQNEVLERFFKRRLKRPSLNSPNVSPKQVLEYSIDAMSSDYEEKAPMLSWTLSGILLDADPCHDRGLDPGPASIPGRATPWVSRITADSSRDPP